MTATRAAAVAGMFYPEDPHELRLAIRQYLADVESEGPVPKAIIAPHAGYIYSGPVAASAYARLAPAHDLITRVILLGPAHRVGFRGLAASHAEEFQTPLGEIPLDVECIRKLAELPQVHYLDEAHKLEHSLEVQLPFLQSILDDFVLIPLLVGEADADAVCAVLEAAWGGPETLIVISSDLSHFHDYATAKRLDSETSRAIESLQPDQIQHENACGRNPVNGLLKAARNHTLHAKTIDLRNSGDTAGPRDQVVGYGAYVFG